MTAERLIEDLLSHQWSEGGGGEDKDGRAYTIYSKGDFFLFLIGGESVADGLYGPEWCTTVDNILVLRHRHDTLSIETKDGNDYDITFSDDTLEVGCSG